MTPTEATQYVKMRFEFESELRSYGQDRTDDGVFNETQFDTFTDEEKIDVAEDLKYQMNEEFGWLLS